MTNILFVCTGNTCRSPMAAHLMRALLAKEGEWARSITVASAGIFVAAEGQPASEYAVRVMDKHEGIDLSGHQAQSVTDALLTQSDLVLTMEARHKDEVLRRMPGLKDRVYTLKEYARKVGGQVDGGDISDPYGLSEEEYDRCLVEIKDALMPIIVSLRPA